MFKQSKLSISISAVSLIILTACGGGGNSFTGDSSPTFVLDKSKLPIDANNNPPPASHTIFTTDAGQQNSPTVVSVDLDNDKVVSSYDKVSFNQPGIVSTICAWDGDDCSDNWQAGSQLEDLAKAVKDAETARKAASEEVSKAEEVLAQATTPKEKKDAQDKLNEAQKILDDANKALSQAQFNNSVPSATGRVELGAPPQSGQIVMMDVNSVLHNIAYSGTIDRGYLKSVNVEKVISSPDAGISKIERIRIRDKDGNARLQPYGGSIDRAFNRVIVFDRNFAPEDSGKVVPEEIQYLDIYFRHPAASDWSYQTFGNFKSQYLDNRRDLLVGYQSIGRVTRGDLPDQKFAEYKGISHAYINSDKQVTMHNYIRANFKNRTLEYKTLDEAVLHTFEGPNKTHVIEVRPDLNISGSASWDKGVPKFRGTVQTASGLAGKMDGRFYGPQAAEVGGVFGIEGIIDGIDSHYVGGFGAKRD